MVPFCSYLRVPGPVPVSPDVECPWWHIGSKPVEAPSRQVAGEHGPRPEVEEAARRIDGEHEQEAAAPGVLLRFRCRNPRGFVSCFLRAWVFRHLFLPTLPSWPSLCI